MSARVRERAARYPRSAAGWILLATACLAAGCSVAERKADRYRVEQAIYAARRAVREAGLARTRPDSTVLLRLRGEFAKVRNAAPPPYIRGGTERSRETGREVLRLIAASEVQSAQLAMRAGRPDLALESSAWLKEHAEGDTLAERQSDFIAVGALRMAGKDEEAIERMRAMLRRYPPVAPPPGSSEEDALLSVPEMMAQVRRDQNDAAGAARELDYGVQYLHGLLQAPREPMLEAQIRARLVRLYLERNHPEPALEQVNALDRLVAAHPQLQSLKPELEYSRAKILASTGKGPEGIAMLEQFADRYPKHPLAPRALLDAAVFLEDAKRLPEALERYRQVVARYPANEEYAPIALFREAMLEERTGDWTRAKRTLESLPVKYPRSQAAVEAPFTIAMRYYARGDREASKVALAKAIVVYQEMIARDSTSIYSPVSRYNILRAHLSLGEWDKALAAVDELALRNPRHPYTAQALLQGAQVANQNGQRDRAAGYLQQYLENFPNSPVAAQVQKDKEQLLR